MHFFSNKNKNLAQNKAFTLVELMVTIAIFAFITAFLAIKYGNSNQGIIVTNLAYDVALTIRQAQSYGLNVKEASTACLTYSGGSGTFQCAYGLFISSATTPTGLNKQFIFFADRNADQQYNPGEEISVYQMKRNIYLNRICTDLGCTQTTPNVNVMFLRPNPDALLYRSGTPATLISGGLVKMELRSPDGSTKNIVVRKTGQISIED